MTKNEIITRHAKRRAAERYGITLNREHYYELCRKIQHCESTPVSRTSNDRTLHIVDGMLAVYSKKRHRIVTFLPREAE